MSRAGHEAKSMTRRAFALRGKKYLEDYESQQSDLDDDTKATASHWPDPMKKFVVLSILS